MATLSVRMYERAKGNVQSLVFTCNVMSHSNTNSQSYELMLGFKGSTVFDAWLGLASYNNQHSISNCAWVNEQHELLLRADWCALKHIKQSTKRT